MITVIIPVLNEEKTIASVVRYCFSRKHVSEVIVVDDKSTDNTVKEATASGAKVVTSTCLGKGHSMREGLMFAKNEVVVFLDGDIDPYPEEMIDKMTTPLLNDEQDFVKASFGRNGGRVTELVAKPLLSMFFPELSHYRQPLGGMIAGKKSLFAQIDLLNDYGVDVGILIDMHLLNARIAEVSIGYIENDSKPLHALGKMSREVASAIIGKAARQKRSLVSNEIYQSLNIIRDQMEQAFGTELNKYTRMMVFDMDDTILKGRFIDTYAKRYGLTEELNKIREKAIDSTIRTKEIAQLLKGKNIAELIETIDSLDLVHDVKEVVSELHDRGYIVGIITDSYDFAANHIRHKIGADFFLANELEFSNSVATGEVKIPYFFFQHDRSSCKHTICKSNALDHILFRYNIKAHNCISMGDSENDICMIRKSGTGIAFRSKNSSLREAANLLIETDSFSEVLSHA